VEAGAPLFTIVDASVVWLTVNIPASAAATVNLNSTATFTVEGSPRTYAAQRIVSIGSVIDSISRTVPIIYEIVNPDGSLKVGANARAVVRTGSIVQGVVVPTSAILDDNGRSIVFVQPEGETFERREVVLGAREGDLAIIVSGVKAGERVVSGAPYQVKLASLSTAVPEHGHEH
jgi:RND family efflux transporter MFP subunit